MKYAVGSYRELKDYYIWVPDLKLRLVSESTTPGALLKEAKASIVDHIATLVKAREKVPMPTVTTDKVSSVLHSKGFVDIRTKAVKISSDHVAKILAYNCWVDNGMPLTSLADRTGMTTFGLRGLWDLKTDSRLSNLVSVVEACGYEMQITVRRKQD